jgi:hypothetical protein
MQQKEYITEKQAAPLGPFAIQTLRNWRHRGIGPPYRKVGTAIRYERGEFLAWLDSYKVTPDKITRKE